MTAQVEDCIKYRRKKYSLIVMSKRIGFNPADYGINPAARSTACWRGYWCEYNVTSEGLFLQNLYINTADDKYPPINGVNISKIEYKDCITYSFVDKKIVEQPGKSEKYMGHKQYKDLDIPIKYTGRVLLGGGFIPKYYIYLGFQRCGAYEQLVEFEFQDGKLVNKINHSDIALKLREAYDSLDSDSSNTELENNLQFLKDRFT